MSSELYSASGPGGNNASLQGTTVGGSKPLHRFIKGQPKITGIIVLVLGTSLFIITIPMKGSVTFRYVSTIPYGFMQGALFILCGILYILTEHNPTKKTVTISLALSVITTLQAFFTTIKILPSIVRSSYYNPYDDIDNNMTDTEERSLELQYEDMALALEGIFMFYSFVGAIIFIVMSTLAGAALRSTKSQTIVMMTTTPTETPAE